MFAAIVSFFKRLFSPAPEKPDLKIVPPPVSTPTEPPPLPKSTGENLLGVDMAHWQEGVFWPDLKEEGVRFCIAKATDGATGIDRLFGDHRRRAVAYGIVPGAYCFNRFSHEPKAQARKLMDVTGGLLPGELCLALDVEWDNSSGSPARYRDGGELDDAGADHVYATLLEIERLSGVTPWIYTAPGFWTGRFKNPERFARFPLWLNDFKAKSVFQLRTPKPWKKPVVWQYGEKKMARVGGVDLNLFLGSEEELQAMRRK